MHIPLIRWCNKVSVIAVVRAGVPLPDLSPDLTKTLLAIEFGSTVVRSCKLLQLDS